MQPSPVIWNSLSFVSGGGGGSSNSFTTIQTDLGTAPVASSATDTLTLTSTVLSITGNSGTDTVTFGVLGNAITDAMLRQSAGLSVIGRSANSTGNVADITAGTDNFVLRRSGTSLAFGLLVNANIDAAAAIAGTKISPDFGSQNITTTGTANAASNKSSGTGGAGFFEFVEQSSAPSTPTNAIRLYADASNRLSWKGENGFVRTFDGTANTADRIYVLPDASTTMVGTDTTQTLTNKSIVATQLTGTLQAGQFPALTGDVTTAGGALATTIATGAVTYAKMQTFGANTFIANNTGSSAAPSEKTYKDNAKATYSGSITWTGTTPPSGGTTHEFTWSQIENTVLLTISLKYATPGTSLQGVAMELPAGLPAPVELSGNTAASDRLFPGSGWIEISASAAAGAARCYIRRNSGDTAYEMFIQSGSGNHAFAMGTVTYRTA